MRIYKEFFKFTLIDNIDWNSLSSLPYYNGNFLNEFECNLNLIMVSKYIPLKMEYILKNIDRLCIISLLTYQPNLTREDRNILIGEMRIRMQKSMRDKNT